MYTAEAAQALHNWLLVRPLKPKKQTKGGIILPFDPEAKTVSEGMGEVISAGPGKSFPDGTVVSHGLKTGDRILYRGFLTFAHQLGDHFGCEKQTDVFALNADDVLAVIEGSGGTIGLFDEFDL